MTGGKFRALAYRYDIRCFTMLRMRFVSAILMDTTEYYARAEADKPRVWCLQCISEYSVVSGLSRSMSLYRGLCTMRGLQVFMLITQ